MRRRHRSPTRSSDKTVAQAPPRRPRSRRRAILFRCVALLLPLLVAIVVNVVLYAFGVGYDTRLVLPLDNATNATHALNQDANFAYFGQRELAGPEPRPFVLPKPPRLFRIVFVGASTVQGFPYPSELAFPRQVEVLLKRQMPQRQFEVLNAAIVGMSSFAVVDVVRQAIEVQPDLIVVYSGHNEFYGPGGVGSTATTWSPSIYPWLTYLRKFRLMQALARMASGGSGEEKPLVEELPRDLEIPWQGETFQAAEHYYRRNLQQMAELAAAADIPILFCSVACNLRSQSPLQSISKAGLTAAQQERRDQLLRQVRDQLQTDQLEQADQALQEAERIDADFSLTVYRRAQWLEADQQPVQAAAAYLRARDLDGCRFRAPGSFRTIVREVARQYQSRGAQWLDLEQQLAQISQYAAPGDDLFLEHVHYSFPGHRQVARLIAEAVAANVIQSTWNPQLVPTDDELDRLLGVTDYDHLIANGFMISIVENQPLKNAADQDLQLQYFQDREQSMLDRLTTVQQTTFIKLNDHFKYFDLMNGMGSGLIHMGQLDEALQMFENAKRRKPWEITGYVGAAKCLAGLQRRDEALANIQQALKLAPNDTDLLRIRRDLLGR